MAQAEPMVHGVGLQADGAVAAIPSTLGERGWAWLSEYVEYLVLV